MGQMLLCYWPCFSGVDVPLHMPRAPVFRLYLFEFLAISCLGKV